MGMSIKYEKQRSCIQTVALFAIIAFIVLVTSGFSNINWNPTYGGWIKNIIFYCLIGYLVFGKKDKSKCHFYKETILMMLMPFLSIINSWSVYDQLPFRSFVLLLGQFTWVIYLLFHKYNISEKTILKALLYVSLFIVIIQIIQQFTYPNAPFGTMTEGVMLDKRMLESAEQRNGLWRFRMHQNAFYTAPILFALWLRLRQKMQIFLLAMVSLLLVSVYLTLTRQVMVACLIAIFCSSFMGKRKINMPILVLGLVLLGGLYVYYDVLFSSLAEQTQADSTEDNVRLIAASMLWDESIKTPLTFLFGYGLPDGFSQYGIHMYKLQNFLGVYTSDVGFIGQIFERGFIYVCICYYMFIKVCFKLKKTVPLYIRMFVIFTGVMSFMIFPCITPAQNIVWVMLLYICDLHINKSHLAIKISC